MRQAQKLSINGTLSISSPRLYFTFCQPLGTPTALVLLCQTHSQPSNYYNAQHENPRFLVRAPVTITTATFRNVILFMQSINGQNKHPSQSVGVRGAVTDTGPRRTLRATGIRKLISSSFSLRLALVPVSWLRCTATSLVPADTVIVTTHG